MKGAIPSAIVLIRLAPIASWVSTSTWTITRGSPRGPSGAGSTRTSISFAPPPRLTSWGCRFGRVAVMGHLDLADHHRVVRLRRETTGLPDDLRGERHRGDHRRLLDCHRNQVVPSIDLKIQAQSEREAESAHRVLDHLVGDFGRERLHSLHVGELLRAQAKHSTDLLDPLRNRQLVESGQTRRHFFRHAISFWSSITAPAPRASPASPSSCR